VRRPKEGSNEEKFFFFKADHLRPLGWADLIADLEGIDGVGEDDEGANAKGLFSKKTGFTAEEKRVRLDEATNKMNSMFATNLGVDVRSFCFCCLCCTCALRCPLCSARPARCL